MNFSFPSIPHHRILFKFPSQKFISIFIAESGLTIVRRLSGKKSAQPQSEYLTSASTTDSQQLEQYTFSSDSQQSKINSGICSFIENRLKMQPTSNLGNDLENVDLTTENLPAVDTPDACDKAALRYVFCVCCMHTMLFIYLEAYLCTDTYSKCT